MKKTKFAVVCTNVDHSEGGIYVASFVPADEKIKDKLKDGFRVEVAPEDFEEGQEPEDFEEAFKIGELYEMTIQEPKKAEAKPELSDEEKAKLAEAKAKKAENDKASKAKKKAEEDQAKANASAVKNA